MKWIPLSFMLIGLVLLFVPISLEISAPLSQVYVTVEPEYVLHYSDGSTDIISGTQLSVSKEGKQFVQIECNLQVSFEGVWVGNLIGIGPDQISEIKFLVKIHRRDEAHPMIVYFDRLIFNEELSAINGDFLLGETYSNWAGKLFGFSVTDSDVTSILESENQPYADDYNFYARVDLKYYDSNGERYHKEKNLWLRFEYFEGGLVNGWPPVIDQPDEWFTPFKMAGLAFMTVGGILFFKQKRLR